MGIIDNFLKDVDPTTITHDNSILSVYALCPRKYLYRKLLKLVPKQEARALTFGSAFHEALFHYYSHDTDEKAKLHYVDVLKAFADRAQAERSQISARQQEAKAAGGKEEHSIEFGLSLLARYINTYPRDSESFKVDKDAEGKPMLEVGFALHLLHGVLVGKMDGIVDNGNLLETKTTTLTLNEKFLSQYLVHGQISLYMAALREHIGKTPRQCVVNVIRLKDYKRETEPEGKIFTRIRVTRSDKQLDQALAHFDEKIVTVLRAIESGFNAFVQNAPDACFFRFHPCEYHQLCQADDQETMAMLVSGGYVQEDWHPYEMDTAKRMVDIKPFEA